FHDVVEATGRSLLQLVFGEGPDLQHFRMAIFLLDGDRRQLLYSVAINQGDWTAHSGNGFAMDTSFAGEAIKQDKPLVYPRDKTRKVPYEERKATRYKSFIVIPVPCRQGAGK